MPPSAPPAGAEKKMSPKATAIAIKQQCESLIASDKLELDGKAPKKIDVLRQFEVKNVRPFTYTALQLKDGTFVLKQVLTGGFIPARPGDGSYTKAMPIPQAS